MGSLPTADATDIDNVQIPSAIAIGDVARVLYYICPPSALQPLPSHLLSVPLLQRHHFLAISTHDPAAYLTWPGDSNSESVLALLEDIRPEDWPPGGLNVIRYAAEPDAVYAHVRLNSIPAFHPDTQSSVRLIFLWDQSSNSWKYHNCAFGDFPQHTHSDLSHAMALFPDDFLPEHTQSLSIDSPDGEDDDDVYWNAYEASEQSLQSIPAKPVPRADTEDAYWAQYASVQGQCAPESPPDLHTNQIHPSGSADSTIPSPRPHNCRLQSAEGDQRIFVPSSKLNPDLPQLDLYNPLAPPSPSSLLRRLASLPTRPDSPPLQDEDDPSSDSAFVTSPSHHADLIGAEEPSTVLLRPVVQSAEAISMSADEALKNTIRGLYQLWRTGKKSRQDFLTLVERAIEEQS